MPAGSTEAADIAAGTAADKVVGVAGAVDKPVGAAEAAGKPAAGAGRPWLQAQSAADTPAEAAGVVLEVLAAERELQAWGDAEDAVQAGDPVVH